MFEGAATGSENEREDCCWQEGTKEVNSMSIEILCDVVCQDREVNMAMMSELRNVLTIRTTNKTLQKANKPRKTRKNKHLKKKGGTQPKTTTDNLSTENILQNKCDPSSTILHRNSDSSGLAMQRDSQDDSKLCDTHNDKYTHDGTLSDTRSNMHGDILEDRDLLLQDANPLFMRQVATMAARMAMVQSSHGHQQEQVFGSDEDQ